MLDAETLDAITMAVEKAVSPLKTQVMSLKASGAVTLPAQAQPGPTSLAAAATVEKRCPVAFNIMASKGMRIPFEADGSVSTFKLTEAMDSAGLIQQRQTIVKTSLLAGGCKLVA